MCHLVFIPVTRFMINTQEHLQEHNQVVLSIIGILICFFGGNFVWIIAAYEAMAISGESYTTKIIHERNTNIVYSPS